MMSPIERAADSILSDLRDRKLLKYLFADEPETRGAYGYVDEPIDLETQREIASTLARAVLQAIREPTYEAVIAGEQASNKKTDCEAIWVAMIDAALSE